jgi:hypothetical protein
MTKLCPPEPKSPLLLYLSTSNSAVSVVLVQEKEEEEGKLKQIPVHFALEALRAKTLLFRVRKDSICSCNGYEKTKALLRGSRDKSYHKSTTE